MSWSLRGTPKPAADAGVVGSAAGPPSSPLAPMMTTGTTSSAAVASEASPTRRPPEDFRERPPFRVVNPAAARARAAARFWSSGPRWSPRDLSRSETIGDLRGVGRDRLADLLAGAGEAGADGADRHAEGGRGLL